MKKLSVIFLSILCVVSTALMFACAKDKTKVTEITYVSGMKEYVKQGETPDYSDLVIKANYSDKTEKTLPYDAGKMTVSFDNATVGDDVTVTISYEGKSCTAKIDVIAADTEITSLEYVSGLPTTIKQGEELDFSELKINAIFSDGKTRTIAYRAADFSVTYDKKASGNVEFTVAYGGKTCKTEITVIKYEVQKVELPAFASAYYAAIGDNTEFKDKNKPYYVGTENDFLFVPQATAFATGDDGKDVRKELNQSGDLAYVANVQVAENGRYVEIDDPDSYYSFNEEMATFRFTEKAGEKSFRLSLRPKFLFDDQIEDAEELASMTVEFTVTVKAGYYNVYDLLDLYVIDNRAEKGDTCREAMPVKEYRESHGITVDTTTLKGIALQGDIQVVKEGLPESFFWTKEEVSSRDYLVGSLKDWTYIFGRKLDKNETFTVLGNYFNIDASKMPDVLVDDELKDDETQGGTVISNAKLFQVDGNSKTDDVDNGEEFFFEDAFLIGNKNRQENVKPGGLIFIQFSGAKGNVNNSIARRWYISVFSTKTNSTSFVTVKDCIFEDNFNSIFYLSGGIMKVFNSEANGAGGPVFIADHVEMTKNYGRNGADGWTSNIILDDYTAAHVSSFVSGSEGWFKQMGATEVVPSIIALDQVFNYGGRTFIKNDTDEQGHTKKLMNIVAVYKSGDAMNATAAFNSYPDGYGTFGTDNVFEMKNAVLTAMLNQEIPLDSTKVTAAVTGMPLFYGKDYSSAFVYTTKVINNVPVTFSAKGAHMTAESVRSMDIYKDESTFLKTLFAFPGAPGRMGIIFGNFTTLTQSN